MNDNPRSAWTTPIDASGWWKLVVAGPVIVVAVILAAGFGVEAWFVGVAAIVFAGLLFSLGLVLGIVQLVTRRSSATPG